MTKDTVMNGSIKNLPPMKYHGNSNEILMIFTKSNSVEVSASFSVLSSSSYVHSLCFGLSNLISVCLCVCKFMSTVNGVNKPVLFFLLLLVHF